MLRGRFLVFGAIGLVLLEFGLVYFIMPMPGSQRMRSVDAAYELYRWRWALRAVFGVLLLLGAAATWRIGGRRRWLLPPALVIVAVVAYVLNFQMAAGKMFRQPNAVMMESAARSQVALDRLVVGVEIDGDARAYPIQFLGYHHQVRDRVAGHDVLVTYCTVCRTGRVFAPLVDGRPETFRLVGMDHFNAMLEDRSTGSWWRQATGEAITGRRKGTKLPELPSRQVTLARWLALYPQSLVMQADSAFTGMYAKGYGFENGTSRGKLTGTDSLSWQDKSWVVGLTVNGRSKAYDWNRLARDRVINDEVGGTPIVLALDPDNASFFAFVRPVAGVQFALRGDSLTTPTAAYGMNGRGPTGTLTAINASQEFWHSWRTFQPQTERY